MDARDRGHEFIGAEHLLLALLDTPSAAGMLRGSGADVEALRLSLTSLVGSMESRSGADTQPNAAFQRIIQRAILNAQSSDRREVDGASVLEAIISDGKTRAAELLSAVPPALARSEGDVQVVIYNDDVTPMQYVVDLLEAFFDMPEEEAKETMLEIHREGKAVCGLYSRKSGEKLVAEVSAHARARGYPLRCITLTPK